MAKLIAVCRDEEFPFERRQIPLMIEETLTMVMEIPETVISAECVPPVYVSQFIKKYSYLSQVEMSAALMVQQKDLFSLLAVSVPCVGCRRSVERLYNQLWQSGQPALEPLTICAQGVLTISSSFRKDAKLIYALFYIHGTHLNDVVDTIPKSKRNKRCILHSLETHKAARASGWLDVWDLLSQECRDEVVLIDSDSLLDTLENYLRKHRFCSECKSKVLKAYSILAGDIDGDSEKGYCATLYEGLKSCPKERHIHVVCDTDFIAHLIGRAEPELAGGRRERHARTIDIAQEEVLTCLGIHLWERLHRLWQKLRAEEQTWQILFYLGVEALRKRFETAVEEKQGISQLELVVEEISEAEKVKEQRRENKRLKKKKRKENKAKLTEETVKQEDDEKPLCNNGKDIIIVNELDLDDCSSEKSSSDGSQASPGKCDQRSTTPPTPSKLSPCSSLSDTSFQGLLKHSDVSPATCNGELKEEKVPISCSTEAASKLSKCKTGNSCVEASTNKTPTKLKNCTEKIEDSCKGCEKETASSPPWLEARRGGGGGDCRNTRNGSVESQHRAKTSNNKNSSSGKDCECESPPGSKNKKNAYYNSPNGAGLYKNNYSNNNTTTNTKRNGDCRSSSSVGPRFSRYENQQQQLQQQQRGKEQKQTDQSDGGDSCSPNENTREKASGTKGSKHSPRSKETSPSILSNSQWGSYNNPPPQQVKQLQHQQSHQQQANKKVITNNINRRFIEDEAPATEVVDENELRLLKSMGWSSKSDDSIGLSEQEIQEFKASKLDVETRRQELRTKLRDQFQKLCDVCT